MTVCGLSLHQSNTESRENLTIKFVFEIGTLNPHGINERFSLTNLLLCRSPFRHVSTNSTAPPFNIYTTYNPQFLDSPWRRNNGRNVSFRRQTYDERPNGCWYHQRSCNRPQAVRSKVAVKIKNLGLIKKTSTNNKLTRLEPLPVVDSTPARADVLYSGDVYSDESGV